jgi:hypothetical protein
MRHDGEWLSLFERLQHHLKHAGGSEHRDWLAEVVNDSCFGHFLKILNPLKNGNDDSVD